MLTGEHPGNWSFALAKMAATLASYFTGIPGGLFSPSLAAGAGFGNVIGGFFPEVSLVGLTLVAMAAFLAGVIQRPITSFVIVMELTGNRHDILLPLMAGAFLAAAVAKLVWARPLYDSLAERMADGQAWRWRSLKPRTRLRRRIKPTRSDSCRLSRALAAAKLPRWVGAPIMRACLLLQQYSKQWSEVMAILKVGVVGGTDTGVELLRLLVNHPQVELDVITSRGDAGTAVADMFPSLRGRTDLVFSEPDVTRLAQCDVVFFATPHNVAMRMMPELMAAGVRVVDLSADFRLRDHELWSEWYGEPHACPELLAEAVYGLPEVNREKMQARLVACAGCYPTSISWVTCRCWRMAGSA